MVKPSPVAENVKPAWSAPATIVARDSQCMPVSRRQYYGEGSPTCEGYGARSIYFSLFDAIRRMSLGVNAQDNSIGNAALRGKDCRECHLRREGSGGCPGFVSVNVCFGRRTSES
jgi:hypothetical protein